MSNKSKIEEMEEEIDREALERKALFSICQSKEHLKLWIKRYLGIDLPDTIVCSDDITNDPSNSSPLDLIWEVYQKALDGTDENFQRVLAYAARDSFKCQKKGTLILTKRGLVPIEQISVGDVVWSGKAWRKVTNWIHDGIKESVKITLSNGLENTGSPIHRVWAWEPGSVPNWKKISELNQNDLVCVDTSHGYGLSEINQDERDIGYLCGILQGDGCLTLMEKYGRVILSTNDNYVLNFFKNACLKYVGREPKFDKGVDWFINSRDLVNLLLSWGLKNCYAHEKEIPHVIYNSKSYMVGFVSGLLDTDGSVSVKKSIELSITATKLQENLLVLLHALGINASLRHNDLYSNQNHAVSVITISQNDIPRLLETGIKIQAKKVNRIEKPTMVSAHDTIPQEQLKPLLQKLSKSGGRGKISKIKKPRVCFPSVSRKKIEKLLEFGFAHGQLSSDEVLYWNNIISNKWVKISKKEIGEADFYDLTVEQDHSYWANGTINHNTLSASILEILCLFHLRRNVAHMAAIESQAQKCASYIGKYIQRPYLKDFVEGKNKREITVCRYEDDEGNILSPDEFDELDYRQQRKYQPISHYLKIIIATLAGANSEHCSFMVLDELDLAPEAPLEEAKMIPAPGEVRGELPITFMTSSRKFAFGNVQKEIDKTNKDKDYGLQVRHWNLLDVTRSCPPERHLPAEPKIPIYYSERALKAINQDEYSILSPEEQLKYYKADGFAGCLKNCSLFSVCRGRLATSQPGSSKMLKPIPHVANQFKSVSVEHAKAQLLCWKPSAEGLVYPNFQYARHMLDPIAMFEAISGEEIPRKMEDGQVHPDFIEFSRRFGKLQLIEYMISRGMEFYSGMDWGYTHNWAVVTGAKDGHRFFVFDVISIPGLEIMQKIETAKSKLGTLPKLVIYPDPEDPASIKTFRRHGFTMKKFTKDVIGGIDAVRSKLLPGLGKDPEIFFLSGDEGCELLAMRMSQYHWKLDTNQKPTDVPDDTDDDECDALRYLIQNLYGTKGRVWVETHGVSPFAQYDPSFPIPGQARYDLNKPEKIPIGTPIQESVDNWLQREINRMTGFNSELDSTARVGRKGTFVYDLN